MSKNTIIDPDKEIDSVDKVLDSKSRGIDEAYENPLVSVSDEENVPALSNPALHRYLQEISQYELLTREETDELAVRFREDGDQDAAYRLVSSNLRLVVKVAMDFQKYWMQNFM
ncbi:MAG: RNA polymerase subunit sigma-70, partial [Desulforhopalus sp.]|nr:RNA polymerase subunit sigma-70 [Desulforhopalus sp.]